MVRYGYLKIEQSPSIGRRKVQTAGNMVSGVSPSPALFHSVGPVRATVTNLVHKTRVKRAILPAATLEMYLKYVSAVRFNQTGTKEEA